MGVKSWWSISYHHGMLFFPIPTVNLPNSSEGQNATIPRSIECQPPLSRMCKFLAGALFVNAGVLLYLHLSRVSVPILGTRLTETPEVSGVRSLVHAVLFLTFFYLGFIQRWKSRSIK